MTPPLNKKGNQRKGLKSSVKAFVKAALLAGGLVISNPSIVQPAEVISPNNGSIQNRTRSVRAALLKKLESDQGLGDKLSYAELKLAQWGNWGNWNNWYNWYNWNNWNNWGNWGNWRNW